MEAERESIDDEIEALCASNDSLRQRIADQEATIQYQRQRLLEIQYELIDLRSSELAIPLPSIQQQRWQLQLNSIERIQGRFHCPLCGNGCKSREKLFRHWRLHKMD